MAKKGKLTDIEKFYIDGHRWADDQELANMLDRSLTAVVNYRKKRLVELEAAKAQVTNFEPAATIEAPPAAKPENPQSATDFMVKESAGGRKGIMIMTPAASERGDATRARRQSGPLLSAKHAGAVRKITE